MCITEAKAREAQPNDPAGDWPNCEEANVAHRAAHHGIIKPCAVCWEKMTRPERVQWIRCFFRQRFVVRYLPGRPSGYGDLQRLYQTVNLLLEELSQ